MKFYDDEHEQLFYSLIERMEATSDVYRKTLAYLISLDSACRQHIERIYDFEEKRINPDCLTDGWQTGTSVKTCRLAFNLYTNITGWTEDPEYVTPAEIFCCYYAPYYWEAIKIRYPEYTM